MELRTKQFAVSTGHVYTIREQNGADDDILSNSSQVEDLMNVSNFISAIVVHTPSTASGKLTPEEAHKLPVLDRYCIMMQSRIFSLGSELEFAYDWGKKLGGEIHYTQDLNEFLFDDYSKMPTPEEVKAKPNAIPLYPMGSMTTDLPIELKSGKKLIFDVLTNEAEVNTLNQPAQLQTKNTKLIARNLRLEVEGKFVKVENFSLFSPIEMGEIRNQVKAYDPTFKGTTTITNPNLSEDQIVHVSIMGLGNFFYLEEI